MAGAADHIFRQARDVLDRGLEEWNDQWVHEWAKEIIALDKENKQLGREVTRGDDTRVAMLAYYESGSYWNRLRRHLWWKKMPTEDRVLPARETETSGP